MREKAWQLMSQGRPLPLACTLLCIALCMTTACENGIIGSGAHSTKPVSTRHGIAQKGPFAIGSNITITTRPAPEYLPAKTEQVQTLDDIGSFEYEFKSDTLYDISVTGAHFNEIDGQLSSDEITLQSSYFQETESQAFVSVNILTHIIHSRIIYLVTVDGMHPRDATAQARAELLDDLKGVIFAEHLADLNFSNMSVYNLENSNANANAVLLFISAAFYQQSLMFASSRTLNDMLTILAQDLEQDGKINGITDPAAPVIDPGHDGSIYMSSLDFAARVLNPDAIRQNLSQHSLEKIGVALPVPDISFLLDNDADSVHNDVDTDDDGDGIPDAVDTNPYQFEIIASNQTIIVDQDSSVSIALDFNRPENEASNTIYLSFDSKTAHGSLVADNNNLIYTPDPGYTGEDSFSYSISCLPCAAVNSGAYSSAPATVTVTITPL